MRPLLLLLLPAIALGQPAKHPNYEDDIKPLFARRCFACHSAGEMRSGLNLEAFSGVVRGGSSGDVVVPGRASASLLYKAVAREEGAPQMPQGQPKLPDAEIELIRDWIQLGLLETATSAPNGPVALTAEYTPTNLNRPAAAPAMPQQLPPVSVPEPFRAGPITALAASPWAPLLAVAGHECIHVYNLTDRSPIGELAFPEGVPFTLRFSRDGATLLAAGGRGTQSGKVVLFDVRTGARRATLGEEMDIVLAADLSPDGKLVALGGPSKVLKVYSVADGRLVYQIAKHTDWITAIEFSPDGKHLASADRAGGIFLWEAGSGGTAGVLAEHKDMVTALSWRGDSQLLASSSEDGQIIVWNVNDGFPAATMAKAHPPKKAPGSYGNVPAGVLSVQFLSDGRLVSVGRDSTIRIWAADGKAKGASAPYDALLTKVDASFDGKLLVAGDYLGRIQVWDGRQSRTISP